MAKALTSCKLSTEEELPEILHTPKRRQALLKHQKSSAGVKEHLNKLDFREFGIETYASLVRSCTTERNLADGKRVHEHIRRGRHSKERYLGNLLIDMYGKCGRVEEARQVFDELPSPNVFSYNIMVAAYAQNGHLSQAQALFDGMPQRDGASWTSIIGAYASQGLLSQAWNLFGSVEHSSVAPWNAIISAYTHNGHQDQALLLFRRMDLQGVQANEITFMTVLDACADSNALELGKIVHASILDKEQLKLDVTLGTALVNMYGKCGALDLAKNIFDQLSFKNVVCWTAMLAAYAHTGHLQESRDLFNNMPVKNVVSWNAIITACARNGEHHKAINMFTRMDLEGMSPDPVSFICVLDACAAVSAVSEGRTIHESLSATGVEEDTRVATSLVHFYGRSGFVEEARAVFSRMKLRNSISWNTLVAVYAHNGHGKEAVEMFREMVVEGFAPDEATFVAVISACSHAGLVRDGLVCFSCAMDEFGFVLSRDVYVCVVDLLGRAAWLDEAEEMVNDMPYEAHSVAWMSLLSSCKVQSDMERAVRAAGNASVLDPANASPYLLLNSI